MVKGLSARHIASLKLVRERDVERYLVAEVKKHGGEVRKVQWIGRRGAPDRLVLLPHAVVASNLWVELKAPGVEPEPHQAREHKKLHGLGHKVHVIDSFEGVDTLLAGASW
jgi:hypothetical protein